MLSKANNRWGRCILCRLEFSKCIWQLERFFKVCSWEQELRGKTQGIALSEVVMIAPFTVGWRVGWRVREGQALEATVWQVAI